MSKIKKKDVRTTIENALKLALVELGLSPGSRKIKKAIKNASDEIVEQAKNALKKKTKKSKKSNSHSKKKSGKPSTA